MPNKCWAPGCKTGYKSCHSTNSDRHLFKAPTDPQRLEAWARRIPRQGKISSRNYICDLHFDERFLVKTFDTVVGQQVVSIPRARWELTHDAIPTIFPGLPSYLSTPVSKARKRPSRFPLPVVHKRCSIQSIQVEDDTTACGETDHAVDTSSVFSKVYLDHSYPARSNIEKCLECRQHLVAQLHMQTRLRKQSRVIKQLRSDVRKHAREIKRLKNKLGLYEHLPPKIKLIIAESKHASTVQSKTGCRYSSEWLLDALLIRCKSTSAYKMLRENGFLPLPSICTLNRAIRSLRPEFGFDPTLLDALTAKLSQFELKERRGILMFDEMQISKSIDFRVDSCKIVGMVDFGELTTTAQHSQEGDHALVFLFQPHMGGWVQTVGCFCSAGTTPSTVLAKLILQCVILLEKCGARVDGLVSDGASTNRCALATMGLCGEMGSLQHKMKNPVDPSRDIYFFCDAPHLLKTVRNNLLRAKEFKTLSGVVQLKHYETLLQLDLNPSTGLRAVPKLTERHIHPNNFQKMSVKLAAQLFSKSVADGMQFYKERCDKLATSGPTIEFTSRMNSVFDLLNGRRPVEGIRLNSGRDRIKELEDACEWLDGWERYIRTLPAPQQKQFLSDQTCRGLRISLNSTLELSKLLLSDGFAYVLTGKFNQDPLEMFFGMVRQSCGGDDHPGANQFLFAYRLLSVNNLIKPPKRASVTGEPINILAEIKSNKNAPIPFVSNIEKHLDQLMLEDDENSSDCLPSYDHSYMLSQPVDCITYYLSGYVTHKLRKFTSCAECVSALTGNVTDSTPDARLAELKTLGGLQIPSVKLSHLISFLESCVEKYSSVPNTFIYTDILGEVLWHEHLPAYAVGCTKHSTALTARCIHFYIATRLHFIKRSVNRNRKSRQKKQKLSKVSKLT